MSDSKVVNTALNIILITALRIAQSKHCGVTPVMVLTVRPEASQKKTNDSVDIITFFHEICSVSFASQCYMIIYNTSYLVCNDISLLIQK